MLKGRAVLKRVSEERERKRWTEPQDRIVFLRVVRWKSRGRGNGFITWSKGGGNGCGVEK
jgi:hypothetical protein